jgi:F0F1-type ATP synthase membrane subunit c/vacuolar-type H+-ATPase subunit K
MEVMGKSPKMATFYLTVTILGIALVESAVIYGLVVAFQLLGAEGLPLYSSIGAGLAIGLAGLGAGI